MRQIVLDTETTGLEASEGHRIIEIGCVEVVNRRITGNTWHQYIQPDRDIDAGAIEVHGITSESLADKPRFADIAGEFLAFIEGAELVIHNAPFDVGFLDHELKRIDRKMPLVARRCSVVDTLVMARRQHPGQRNSLDALCKRYEIDNSRRELHRALLDAEILADVYQAKTRGQTALSLDSQVDSTGRRVEDIRRLPADRPALRVITATADELAAHDARLDAIGRSCGTATVWRQLEEKG